MRDLFNSKKAAIVAGASALASQASYAVDVTKIEAAGVTGLAGIDATTGMLIGLAAGAVGIVIILKLMGKL